MIGLRKTAPATHIADVWAEERFIYVEAVNSESMLVQSLMKGIPSQVYDPVMLTWQFMASPSVAIRIREVLGSRARYHYTFDNVLEHGKSTDSAQALKNVNPESFPEIPGMMGESWPHQKQAYAYISRVLGIGSRSGGTSGAGLFADMGCVSGNAIVTINRGGKGKKFTLSQLYEKFNEAVPGGIRGGHVWDSNITTYIRSLVNGEFRKNKVLAVLDKGVQPVMKLTLEDGKTLVATADHEILTDDGWIRMDALNPGDMVLTNGRKSLDKDGYVREGFLFKDHPRYSTGGIYGHIPVMENKIGRSLQSGEYVHHIDGDKSNNDPSNLQLVTQSEHAKIHGWHRNITTFLPKEVRVVSVEDAGEDHVYDVVCEHPHHNFVANSIVVHNCGKTRVGLGLIAANPRLIRRVLIICPKRVIKTWPEEASKHMPSESMLPMYLLAGITNKTAREWEQEFEYTIRPDIRSYVRIYNGTTKERGEAIIDHKLTPGIFVCNYDALVYPHFADALYECEWDLIILDEAHKIKAAGGKTSKFMARLGKKARYKLGQTGTPNADKPIDLYGLYRFLDPGIFGTSFNRFKDRYAVFGGYQGREIIGYQNLDELSDKMYTIAFRVTDEVTKLPPTMEHIVRVNLGPKAREAYEELKEEMVYSLAEGTITVQNALTKILRLQQITSGYVPMQYVEGSEDQLDAQLFTKLQYFEKDKQEALLEIMEDMPEKEPLVVFCKFVQDLEYIKEAAGMMGRPYLEISGRRDDLGKFKNPDSGNCVLGVQITAGGAGVDLTRAHYVVYYSLTHSLTSYEQSLKRVHRPGQKNTVHYYYLTASNTIDVLIRKALREKKSVAKYVLDNVQQDQYYTDPAWGVSQMVGV